MTTVDDKVFGWTTDPASDQRRLRSVFGGFLTGVTTVSFRDEDRVWAFTANSFTSVSLDPPLVLFCIANRSASAERLRCVEEFCISFLAEDQQHISDAFGRPSQQRDELAHSAFEGPVPALRGATATLVCRREQRVSAGDHLIILGRVLRFRSSEARPLGYLRGQYVIPIAPPAATQAQQP